MKHMKIADPRQLPLDFKNGIWFSKES
jgi:hypothetical protein